MVAHGQQRHHQFVGVRLGQPCHVLVDDALDRVAGFVKIAAQARCFRRSRGYSCSRTNSVKLLRKSMTSLRRPTMFSAWRRSIEAAMVSRLCSASACACSKLTTRLLLGLALKSFTSNSHRPDRAFEIAAGIGERGGILDGLEGGADVAFAGNISEPIGEEPDHRDQRQHDDAGAHRNRGEQPAQPVGWKR